MWKIPVLHIESKFSVYSALRFISEFLPVQLLVTPLLLASLYYSCFYFVEFSGVFHSCFRLRFSHPSKNTGPLAQLLRRMDYTNLVLVRCFTVRASQRAPLRTKQVVRLEQIANWHSTAENRTGPCRFAVCTLPTRRLPTCLPTPNGMLSCGISLRPPQSLGGVSERFSWRLSLVLVHPFASLNARKVKTQNTLINWLIN